MPELPIQLSVKRNLPFICPPVFRTGAGTPYLKEAGVAVISVPSVDLSGVQGFLDGFDEELGFGDYLADPFELPEPEQLVKFLGQTCYLSLGEKRTWNRDAQAYFDNLKSSGHGSVTEHPNVTVFVWGIDRSVTHEIVRHRAGFGFSQVSQRYVDGTKLRFVERPEYQAENLVDLHLAMDPAQQAVLRASVREMHLGFEEGVDEHREIYDMKALALLRLRELGHPMLQAGQKTDARKQINQVAREGLPNSTEAPIGITANIRAWRHFTEMRASKAADVPIRNLAMKIFRCLSLITPRLTSDYRVIDLAASSTQAVETDTRKI